MKNIKKLVSLILATTLGLSMVACTGGKKGADNNGTAVSSEENFKGKKLTVGIWGGNEGESTAIEKVKADFEAKTGATVDLKVYTDYNTQVQADFIGKTAPDVFYVDAYMLPFYSSLGVLEELDKKEMETDKFYENLVKSFEDTDGKLYSVPKDFSTLSLYYNIGLLESVGMTADDIPTAWEDFGPFLTALQAKLDAKHGAGKITAMTYNQDLARNLHLLERDGAEIVDTEGKSQLSSDGVVKNLQFIVDLTKTGAYKTPQEIGFGWNGEAFGTGNVVLMEEGNWVYGTMLQDYSDIKFGVKDMPSYKGEKSSMAFTVGYGVYSGSKEKELAKEWIKYATGVEGMNTWCSGAGTLPSRSDVAEKMNVESDPIWAAHLRQVEYARTWQKGLTISIVNGAYQNFLPSAVKGEATVKEAMEKADKQANDEINNGQ